MSYQNNDMYKAFRLKLSYLTAKLSGQYDHTISKLGMFAEDAFSEQESNLARLQAENKRLRDALKTVLRKANSLAGYYPESGDEREAYGMDAPLVFDDIRKTARVALEGGEYVRKGKQEGNDE